MAEDISTWTTILFMDNFYILRGNEGEEDTKAKPEERIRKHKRD